MRVGVQESLEDHVLEFAAFVDEAEIGLQPGGVNAADG